MELGMHLIIFFIFYIFCICTYASYFLPSNLVLIISNEALALYNFTIFGLNIVIKVDSNATKPLPTFGDYIESWRVTCWKMVFFLLFYVDRWRYENKTFKKNLVVFKLWDGLFTGTLIYIVFSNSFFWSFFYFSKILTFYLSKII